MGGITEGAKEVPVGELMPPKLRRPAARGARAPVGVRGEGGRVRRRPALRVAEPVAPFDQAGFDRGVEVESSLVPLEQWKKGLRVVISEGTYWEERIQAAGIVQKLVATGEEVQLEVDLRGTQCEALVKWKGANPGKLLLVDLCRKDCGFTSMDGLVHCQRIRKLLPDGEEAWMRNLEGMETREDELALLRGRADALGKMDTAPPGDAKATVPSEESSSQGKKKKKKKSKKEKKAKKRILGTKSLKVMFEMTGLDPEPQQRKRILKRAQRLAKKRSRRDSSSGSSSTSSEESSLGEETSSGLFGEETKVRAVWTRYPGSLTQSAVRQLQRSLIQQSGQPWEVDQSSLPPIFSQYWRMVLDQKASRAISREMQTLAFVLDLLLQGRPASAADAATQRLKSLEQMASGGDYRVTQRLEVVPLESSSMSSTVETLEASRVQREEVKAKSAAAKGWERPRGKGDYDSWDSKGKSKKGDFGKGKGKGGKWDGKKGDSRKGDEEKDKK